jgi:hypothetical protein
VLLYVDLLRRGDISEAIYFSDLILRISGRALTWEVQKLSAEKKGTEDLPVSLDQDMM